MLPKMTRCNIPQRRPRVYAPLLGCGRQLGQLRLRRHPFTAYALSVLQIDVDYRLERVPQMAKTFR
jgi:hypothetical protein